MPNETPTEQSHRSGHEILAELETEITQAFTDHHTELRAAAMRDAAPGFQTDLYIRLASAVLVNQMFHIVEAFLVPGTEENDLQQIVNDYITWAIPVTAQNRIEVFTKRQMQ